NEPRRPKGRKERKFSAAAQRGLGYFVIWQQAKMVTSFTNYPLPITNYRPQRIISVFKRI
ncbi:hypothetical protein CEN45_09635, partial [Fischerella thermalis CCMEE 5198]|uniref:hypothetical protein n=1 Tax=Fischerella thermalis TaxID=372787 RepID=UPI000CB30F33